MLFRKNVNRPKKTLLNEIETLAANQGILAEQICRKALRYRNELVKKNAQKEQNLPHDIAVYGEVEEFLEALHEINKNQQKEKEIKSNDV